MKRPTMNSIKELNYDMIRTWQFYDKAEAWEGAPIDRKSFLTALSVLDYVINGADYQIMSEFRTMMEVADGARETA